MEFIQVQTFDDYVSAHIVLGYLQEQDINCWLKDENTVTVNPVWNIAVGGIKLMVSEDQAEKAITLLTELNATKKENYTCPECGSNNIEYITSNRKAVNWITAALTWILGSYAMSAKKIWHCFNCGEEFEKPLEKNSTTDEN